MCKNFLKALLPPPPPINMQMSVLPPLGKIPKKKSLTVMVNNWQRDANQLNHSLSECYRAHPSGYILIETDFEMGAKLVKNF